VAALLLCRACHAIEKAESDDRFMYWSLFPRMEASISLGSGGSDLFPLVVASIQSVSTYAKQKCQGPRLMTSLFTVGWLVVLNAAM
jgi:hypothetical protein